MDACILKFKYFQIKKLFHPGIAFFYKIYHQFAADDFMLIV